MPEKRAAHPPRGYTPCCFFRWFRELGPVSVSLPSGKPSSDKLTYQDPVLEQKWTQRWDTHPGEDRQPDLWVPVPTIRETEAEYDARVCREEQERKERRKYERAVPPDTACGFDATKRIQP